jgi:hypothetical protein
MRKHPHQHAIPGGVMVQSAAMAWPEARKPRDLRSSGSENGTGGKGVGCGLAGFESLRQQAVVSFVAYFSRHCSLTLVGHSTPGQPWGEVFLNRCRNQVALFRASQFRITWLVSFGISS